ncbi:MAG: thiamine pyrophosphate-dependent dehydrogenase E1 component subunit alpha [Candidatus Omnitrophica bacterium]|nr:thiamine pyrophosphate-dependent dehydrogenase E1 component subunit alpha [Candidatus Omnitrophota bacterium]MBU0881484.1 thiamine pyrophosphate-dependent dehydrogenase E1 component subunit alpha [Candidatus Omnitrophota bacterium]MBU1808388.1 thiamine pyrophosphate-dependent dehydrogenase E1 component subunit alpha [Candidatus Omnitrophota bacterium]
MKNIPKKRLLELYITMRRIRLTQLEIEKEYSADEMKTPIHLCLGQEAIASGVCANLRKDDYVFSNHRGHGHYIAKGGDLKSMIAELYCKKTGCSASRGGSMHLIDLSVGCMGSSSIVAGSIPIATGAALTSAMTKDKRVSVVFFGDAASEEGVLFESMNFAALKKLPVVYVCENNFYSVCSHQSARQANCDISMRPKAFAIPSCRVDGSDVLDVYAASKKAIESARAGSGPSFLECRAYRWRAHAGAGDPHKETYRKPKEWDAWMRNDPFKKFEDILLKKKIMTPGKMKEICAAVDKEISEAFEFAKRSPLPDKADLEKYLHG